MGPVKIPDQLLKQACPSIQYRLRLEVLDQPGSDGQMLALQSQILEEAAVKVVDVFEALLETQARLFTKPLRHAYFSKWGAYTGLILENDWKDPRRRIYDLTFRSILILYYYMKWRFA